MNSSLAFSEYMHKCLYDQKSGYYMQEENPIGRDFITAPEVSSALAYACAEAFCKASQDIERPVLCELGPGSGKLMFEMLNILASKNSLPDKVWLIELNQARRNEQEHLLKGLPIHVLDKCEWYSEVPEISWQGMLLANEVLDAQPFDIIFKDNDTWYEMRVINGFDAPEWEQAEIRKELLAFLPNVEVSGAYRTEIFSGLPKFLDSVTKNLTLGSMLFIDYGYSHREYYHPQRFQGTSKVFFGNQVSNDLLFAPGKCDITSHVDFSLVYNSLMDLGFCPSAYMTQAQFLVQTNALEHFLEMDKINYNKACTAFKSLVYDMGDVFKVFLVEHNISCWQDWFDGFGIDRL